jgi:hypothetical protein
MLDRKNVIEGLREMSCRATWKDIDRIRHKFQPIINDAIVLLKEQEPKNVTWSVGRAHCPSCGELFPKKKENQYIRFCSFCGQAVTFE